MHIIIYVYILATAICGDCGVGACGGSARTGNQWRLRGRCQWRHGHIVLASALSVPVAARPHIHIMYGFAGRRAEHLPVCGGYVVLVQV